jgi:hypothetical protein
MWWISIAWMSGMVLAHAESEEAAEEAAPVEERSGVEQAVPPSTPSAAAEVAEPRVVRRVYLSREVDRPGRVGASIQELAASAGGQVVSSASSTDADDGASASLTVLVPVEQWAAVESGLELGATGSLDTERIPRLEQEGDGPPHVSLEVELSESSARQPNFLIGAVGALSIPLDGSGLGLAQQVGVRLMGPEREGIFEAAYAPANQVDAFGQPEPWMLKLTVGDAVYSEFLGNGERTFFNPYIGGQLGYAYRGESWFLLQAEMGLELVHAGHVIWDVYARPVGAFRKGAVGLSVEAGTGLVVPF